MKKKTQKYMIVTSMDYADEFDYPIISLFTEVDKKTLEKKLKKGKFDWDDELGFGTNEALTVSLSEATEIFENAEEISDKKYKFLQDLDLCGIDIVERMMES